MKTIKPYNLIFAGRHYSKIGAVNTMVNGSINGLKSPYDMAPNNNIDRIYNNTFWNPTAGKVK